MKSTVVDKIKMNDDHSLVAFTVDIGNIERCSGGVKDMKTDKVIRNIKLDDISQLEFFGHDHQGNDILYYVELNEHNRPYKVKRRAVSAAPDPKEWTIFIDDDPTHYIDIGISKDKKYLFINSGTKEDSEIWVIPSSEGKAQNISQNDEGEISQESLEEDV